MPCGMRAAALALALLLCAPASADITRMEDVTESHQMWQDGYFVFVLDVRSDEEYEGGHIEGAYLQVDMATTAAIPDWMRGCEDCAIAVYCRSGRRAQIAAEHLEAAGFTRLYNILGVNQWTEAGFPLVTGPYVPPRDPACHTSGVCSASMPDDDDDGGGGQSISVGAAVGIAVGGAAGVALVCAVCWWVMCHRPKVRASNVKKFWARAETQRSGED